MPLPHHLSHNKKNNDYMAHKLWEKNFEVNKEIERFTVGRDRELDLYLAKYDVLGSMAHITMLESIGLLEKDELQQLLAELKRIYAVADSGQFVIEDGVEDVHSQVELMLTQRLGDMGKKIHSGRSRNDQVLVDLKLFTRHELREVVDSVKILFDELLQKSEQYKNVLMPGYTHLQVAMPSSFGLWFGAYAESLADDMLYLLAAWRMTNRNPLGSAAGYGSSFPLNRTMTTELLGFDSMDYNVVYAQMGRGKNERNVAFALAGIAGTVAKLAFDACMFNSQNFGFVRLPDECTTGSSIMPHKKNPISAENLCGLSRVMRSNSLAALEDQALWHERDISHSSVERVILPDSSINLDYCTQKLTDIIDKLLVYPDKMLHDMNRTGGLIYSQRILLSVVDKGVLREDAYKWVQRNAMKRWMEGQDFRTSVEQDPDITKYLTKEEIDDCFDYKYFLRHVDMIFERFGL